MTNLHHRNQQFNIINAHKTKENFHLFIYLFMLLSFACFSGELEEGKIVHKLEFGKFSHRWFVFLFSPKLFWMLPPGECMRAEPSI